MSWEQRDKFDADIGLTEVRAMPVDDSIPPELQGVTPPAWWANMVDGGSWSPQLGG
jgi:hypothetical protein